MEQIMNEVTKMKDWAWYEGYGVKSSGFVCLMLGGDRGI